MPGEHTFTQLWLAAGFFFGLGFGIAEGFYRVFEMLAGAVNRWWYPDD